MKIALSAKLIRIFRLIMTNIYMENKVKLEIKLQPSRCLAFFLLLMHLGAIVCVLLLNFPIWLNIILISLISYSFYVFLHNNETNKIRYQDGEWYLDQMAVQLDKDSFISRFLIILNFSVGKKRYSIPILGKELRNLRVLLYV